MFTEEFNYTEHEQLKIGILSDTHGVLNNDIREFITSCDIALHAGDVMAATPLLQLQPRLDKVHAVRGNNDFPSIWAAEEHSILADIADAVILYLPGGKLAMEHSDRFWSRDTSETHTSLRRAYADAALIIYGHTHIRTIDDQQTPWVANPGAAGTTRTHDGPSCLELNVNAEEWTLKSHLF